MKRSRYLGSTPCIVAAVLFLTVAVGVGATGGQGEATRQESMVISWLGQGGGPDKTGSTWLTEEVEQKFGVQIEWNGLHQDDTREQIDILIATGDMPDVFFIWKDATELYLDGVTRGIPKEMIERYAPNYTKIFKQDDPLGWLMNVNPDDEEEFLCLLSSRKWLDSTFSYIAFRAHWAKAAGFELPNYDQKKIPLDNLERTGYGTHISYFLDEDFTLEWFERLLRAFRDNDLDGNGRDDTIPWAGNQDWYWTWNPIMGAFGIARDFNFEVGGELYEWCIAPQYKEFLAMAARWWEERLIDQEFVNLNWDQWNDKNVAGLTGACVSHFAYQANKGGSPNGMVKPEEAGTGAEVVTIRPLVGPSGAQGSPCYSPANGLRTGEFVSRTVEDAKLAKILQILDWLIYGELEQWVWVTYGKPGVHSDWAGEPYSSAIKRRPLDEIGGKQWWGAEHPTVGLRKHVPIMYPAEMADFWMNYIMGDEGQALAIRPYRWDILNETGLADVRYEVGADLTTFVDEFFFRVVTGTVDLDAEWDSYVAQWRRMGGDRVLEALGRAPLVSEYRQGRLVY